MVTFKELGRQVWSSRGLVRGPDRQGMLSRYTKPDTFLGSLFPNLGTRCVHNGEFFAEAVNDIFTEWFGVPSRERAPIDGTPFSRVILVPRSTFNRLVFVVPRALSVLCH